MFDVEQSHQEIIARIASLERILSLLTPDVESLLEERKRDCLARVEDHQRKAKGIHVVK